MKKITELDSYILQERVAMVTPTTEMIDEDGAYVATGKVVQRKFTRQSYGVWDAYGDLVAQMNVTHRWFSPQVDIYDKNMRLCGSMRCKGCGWYPRFRLYDVNGVEFCQLRRNFWGSKYTIQSIDGEELGCIKFINKLSFKEIFTLHSKKQVTLSLGAMDTDKRFALAVALFVTDRLMRGKSL